MMIDITREINRWLAQNAIPGDDVHVTIQFPNEHAARTAEAAIMHEVTPMTFGRIDPKGRANEMTMNGISLTLDYRK